MGAAAVAGGRQFLLRSRGDGSRDGPPTAERCSLVSGVSIEDISRLVGHGGSAVTERVYRHQIRPVLQGGAAAMDALFAGGKDA